MLLQPSVDVPSEQSNEWQNFLITQVGNQPLFRRKQVQLLANAGRVTLFGRVSSYYDKQLAQETIRHIEGVEEIDNCLEVSYPGCREPD